MIKVGDRLPAGTVKEYIEVEGNGCSLGPNAFDVQKEMAGKTVAIFAVPGAFTPTCSAQHVPAAGVSEIWCLSVNDPFVMGAWGRDQKAAGAVRMMADGSGDYTRALGLVLDLKAAGLGERSQRYSMLVKDGVVLNLNVDQGGKLEVSDASTLLAQAQKA